MQSSGRAAETGGDAAPSPGAAAKPGARAATESLPTTSRAADATARAERTIELLEGLADQLSAGIDGRDFEAARRARGTIDALRPGLAASLDEAGHRGDDPAAGANLQRRAADVEARLDGLVSRAPEQDHNGDLLGAEADASRSAWLAEQGDASHEAVARAPRGARTGVTQSMDALVAGYAKLDDAALQKTKGKLTAHLTSPLRPEERDRISRQRDAIEWVEYQRQLERGESGRPETYGQELDAAQDAGRQFGHSAMQIGARSQLEAAYRAGGAGEMAGTRWALGARGNDDQRKALGDQAALVSGEAEAFKQAFRDQATHTAIAMLDRSSIEIEAALKQYGFVGGSHRLHEAARAYNQDPDNLDGAIADWRTLSDTGDRRAEQRKGDEEQRELAVVVRKLRTMQAEVDELEREEKNFTEQDWERRDIADPARNSPAARARLAEAYAIAEEQHPILLAYRHPEFGADTSRLGDLTAVGAGMEESILRQAIPKLGNILRTKIAIRTGQLSPLRMGPVVEMIKQEMHVPPGSERAAIARDLYNEASKQSLADWALSAISLALAVVSFVPGVGLGAKAAAEAVSLAIELRSQVNEYSEWKVAGGMNNTALDLAKSVSVTAPELRPLLLRLAVAGASVASLTQLLSLSAKLRAVRAAESAADDVLRELDELGARHGLKNLGDEVDGAVRGAKVYPAKSFVKAEVTRLSKLNVEKVTDGLRKTASRAFARGARFEAALAKASAEGASGVLRVADGGGEAVIHVEIELTGALSGAGRHGAESGPARFFVETPPTGPWKARIELSENLDPNDVQFVLGHELDEISELRTRFPKGKPEGGFGAELDPSIMRQGATQEFSTAHDIANAREIVALDADYKKLLKGRAKDELVKHRSRSIDEAIKVAGLDEPAVIEAKVNLLKQHGAPEDLLDRVRRVGSKATYEEHVAAMGQKGTRFTEDMIDHVMWGRGHGNQGFKRSGIEGGHSTDRLMSMGYPNSEYVFVESHHKAAAGTTARQYKQYKWTGSRASMPAPGSGRFPSDPQFTDAGWITTDMPKTTFDDPAAFLREAEDAWEEMLAGRQAAFPPGHSPQANELTAITKSGIQFTAFTDTLPDGRVTPTTIFVEASWF